MSSLDFMLSELSMKKVILPRDMVRNQKQGSDRKCKVLFTCSFSDAAEIVQVRPKETAGYEYYVHYEGCKLINLAFDEFAIMQ